MAKISGKYETIFIVNPKLEEAAATAVVDKFKSLVEALSWTVSTRSRTASCVPSSSAWTTKAVNTNAQ